MSRRTFSRSVSTEAYSFRARILLYTSRKLAAQRISLSAGRLEAIDDEHCLLHAGANSLDALAIHLSVLGFEFEVQQPPELIEHFRAIHGRVGRSLAGRKPSTKSRRARGAG